MIQAITSIDDMRIGGVYKIQNAFGEHGEIILILNKTKNVAGDVISCMHPNGKISDLYFVCYLLYELDI